MFTQIKRIAIAFATIFILIGAMPSASAQSVFAIWAEEENESFFKDNVIGSWTKRKHTSEVELFISRAFVYNAWVVDENKVNIKHTFTQEAIEGDLDEWACSFKGEYTNLVKKSDNIRDLYLIDVSGELTQTTPYQPEPTTFAYSGNIYVYDYFSSTYNDMITFIFPQIAYCQEGQYAAVEIVQ